MKNSLNAFSALWALALLLLAPVCAAAALEETYRLGTGDKIQIRVFGEEDLSLETRVGDAEVINYPFLGEVRVGDLTPKQLEARLVEGLKPGYLVDPSVSVSILEYRNFYIYGEVGEPGGYAFSPGLTVRNAVAMAGGFTERASRSKIFVVHEDDPAARTNSIDINERVRPGDTITIEQSFF